MGTLSFNFKNNKFYFGDALSSDGKQDQVIADQAKFLWDASTLRWVTRSPLKAAQLRRFADKSAEQKFKKYFITSFKPPEQIIYPDHLEPREFQIDSTWHCTTRSPAYCADEAGLGKTITAALCINTVEGRALIICPPFLKYNWQLELSKWLVDKGGTAIIESTNLDQKALTFASEIILPDSLLTNITIQSWLKRQKFTWLFVDEAHRYKEATTQRTQALVGKEEDSSWEAITDCAERVVLLSGTPIPNGRPKELYPLLSQLAPESIGHRDFMGYGKTFCDGRRVVRHEGKRTIINWDFNGASNLKQLRRQLRSKLMIRHLKKDVLKELPAKTRKIVFLDEVERLRPFEQKVLKKYSLEELMGEDCDKGEIATYRREVGLAKINPAFLYISELLENSPDKLVIFAHHIDVVMTLDKMLEPYHSLYIRGDMSPRAKQRQVKLFQTQPKHRVIIGNIESMGVGNTLTKAPGVIFVEFDYRPGINEQAEDRVHRMTQEKNVYIRYLTLRNSLDERMLSQTFIKQKAITQLMD